MIQEMELNGILKLYIRCSNGLGYRQWQLPLSIFVVKNNCKL